MKRSMEQVEAVVAHMIKNDETAPKILAFGMDAILSVAEEMDFKEHGMAAMMPAIVKMAFEVAEKELEDIKGGDAVVEKASEIVSDK